MSAIRKLKKLFSGKTNKTKNIKKDTDEKVRQQKEKESKIIKILLLGSAGVGKTTILNQIVKIYSQHDGSKMMARYCLYIKEAVVAYMKILCYQSQVLNDRYNENTLVNENLQCIRQEMLQMPDRAKLTKEIVFKMKRLWNDNGIKETLKQRHYYQIHDNVAYFLNKIDEIAADGYIPTFDDYLRIGMRSTGIVQHKLNIHIDGFGEHIFEFTAFGGARFERRRLLSTFRFVEFFGVILYVVDIASYNLKLFEDNETNRLIEAMDVFKALMGRMLKEKEVNIKNVIICFNKYDLFKEKIKSIPITVTFGDFPINEMNANDERDVIYFVADKFVNLFEQQYEITMIGPLPIFLTTALDGHCIQNMIKGISNQLTFRKYNNVGFVDIPKSFRERDILLINGYIREVQHLVGELIIPNEIFMICLQFYYAKYVIM